MKCVNLCNKIADVRGLNHQQGWAFSWTVLIFFYSKRGRCYEFANVGVQSFCDLSASLIFISSGSIICTAFSKSAWVKEGGRNATPTKFWPLQAKDSYYLLDHFDVLKTQKFYIIQIEFDSYSCCAIYYQGRDHPYITSVHLKTFSIQPTHPPTLCRQI